MHRILSLAAFLLLRSLVVSAQAIPELQNLEGAWYQAGRGTVCYSIWKYSDNATLENRTFSIVCGDTIELSRAVVADLDGEPRMVLRADSAANGAPQAFRLVETGDDVLRWENENPGGVPRQLEWHFFRNSFCIFKADGTETDYRRKRVPMKLQFRISAGVNLSTFAKKRAFNHFLALQNVGIQEVSYQRLPGQEVAISAGLLFPETALCLNMEVGITHRQIGVHARFSNESVGYSRDGTYDYFNTYFALVPEIYIGKKRDLSVMAGFYFDLAQQRNFRGAAGSSLSGAVHADPRQDIDVERGFLAGVSYRLPLLERFQPALYVRNTFGLNNTKVRAVSLGLSFRVDQ